MRFFSLIFCIFLLLLALVVDTTSTFDLTVFRSLVIRENDGSFYTMSSKPQNIWYIGIDNREKYNDEICVEWDLGTEKKKECIDHDGVD